MTKEELYKELAKQKEQMTPQERLSAYLKGEETDCLPYGLLAPEDALAHIWGYTLGQVRRSFRLRCEMIRRREEEYGFSGLSVSLGLRGMAEAAGSTLYYPENAADYVKEYCVMDYGDLDRIECEFHVDTNPVLKGKLEEGRRLRERFPHMEISTDAAGPFSTAAAMRPIELVLRDIRKNPEELHRLLSFCVSSSLKWVEKFCRETGSKSVGLSDPVTSSDILGIKYFREFSRPHLKELIDGIVKITGNTPSLHICGHTKPIWEDLMEIGIRNFSLDNCENLREATEIMCEKVFISGNVDPVDVMLLGDIDAVVEAVKKAVEKGSGNPSGYMLLTGCQVPIGTPKENIDAYIYAARKYGAAAKKGRLCKTISEN